MDADKAQRIYICLNELIILAEKAPDVFTNVEMRYERSLLLAIGLQKLISKPEYKEMKEWLEGKKK